MKKLLSILILIFSLNIQADTLDFNTETDVDKLAFLAFDKDPFAVEDNVWGSWFLYHRNYDLYREVHQDEFELEDAANAYLKKFKKMTNYYLDKYKNKTFTITTPQEFGKYKSKGGYFKLNKLTSKSFFKYDGDNMVDDIEVSFKNTASAKDYDKIFLPKSEARLLVKNRKSSSGRVSRTVHVRFDYKIADIKITHLPTMDGDRMDLKIFGKIVKMDYIDQATGKILRTINFKN